MIRIFLLSLIILIFQANIYGETCFIYTPKKIWRISNDKNFSSNLIRESNCRANVKKSFIKRASEIPSKTISNGYIVSSLREEFPELKIITRPKKIKVFDLGSIISKKINLQEGLVINNLRSISNINSFTPSDDQTLEVNVPNIENLGSKNIKISLRRDGHTQEETFWLTGKLVQKLKALVAIQHLGVRQNGLTKSLFEEKIIETDKPESYFSDLKKIHFYQTLRPLRKGQPLTKSQMSLISIVRPGTPVKAVMSKSGLSLSRKFRALQGGKLGDLIKLQTFKNNQNVIGKVIDLNTVRIEL